MISAEPRSPKGLGAAGRALWSDITNRVELEQGEEALLTEACRTADELTRLETELRGAELTVAGSTGQSRPNPLLLELRAHRLCLVGLLKALQPAVSPARATGSTVSNAARDAASARWARDARVVS